MLPKLAMCAIALTISSAAAADDDWRGVMDEGGRLEQAGNYTAAAEKYREAERLAESGDRAPVRLPLTLNALGLVYDIMGRYADAERQFRRTLTILDRTIGKENAPYGIVLANLAAALSALGRYPEAERLDREALALHERVLGVNDVQVALSRNALAEVLVREKRYDEAARLQAEAAEILETRSETERLRLGLILINLAATKRMLGRKGESVPLLERALPIVEHEVGPGCAVFAGALNNAALVYTEAGRSQEADAAFRRSLEIYERTLGADHPSYAQVLANYAAFLERRSTVRAATAWGSRWTRRTSSRSEARLPLRALAVSDLFSRRPSGLADPLQPEIARRGAQANTLVLIVEKRDEVLLDRWVVAQRQRMHRGGADRPVLVVERVAQRGHRLGVLLLAEQQGGHGAPRNSGIREQPLQRGDALAQSRHGDEPHALFQTEHQRGARRVQHAQRVPLLFGDETRGDFGIAGEHGQQQRLARRIVGVVQRPGGGEAHFGHFVVQRRTQDGERAFRFPLAEARDGGQTDLDVLVVHQALEFGEERIVRSAEAEGGCGELARIGILIGERGLYDFARLRFGSRRRGRGLRPGGAGEKRD
jgi:tetratricopeptide (TPR) repeat protein